MKISTQLSQIRVLFKKNLLVLKDKMILIIVFTMMVPVAVGLLCGYKSSNSSGDEEKAAQVTRGIQKCKKSPLSMDNCMNLGFAPVTAETTKFIEKIIAMNSKIEDADELSLKSDPIANLSEITADYQVYGFKDKETMMNFYEENIGKLSIEYLIVFNKPDELSDTVDVELISSDMGISPMIDLLGRISIKDENGDKTPVITLKSLSERVQQANIVDFLKSWAFQIVFFVIGIMLINISLCGRIMEDLKNDLLNYMRMCGMSITNYHTALYLSELFVVQTLAGACFALGGYIGKGYIFVLIDFRVWVVMWYLLSASYIGFNLLISSIIPSPVIANIVSVLMPLCLIIDYYCIVITLMGYERYLKFLHYVVFLFPARFFANIMLAMGLKVVESTIDSMIFGSITLQRIYLSDLLEHVPESRFLQILSIIMGSLSRMKNSRETNADSERTYEFPSLVPGLDLFVWLVTALTFPLLAAYLRDVLPWNEGRKKSLIFFLVWKQGQV